MSHSRQTEKSYLLQLQDGESWKDYQTLTPDQDPAKLMESLSLQGYKSARLLCEYYDVDYDYLERRTVMEFGTAFALIGERAPAPYCREGADMTTDNARPLLRRLTHDFLLREGVTVLELLYDIKTAQKFEAQGTQLQGVLQRIAGLQGRQHSRGAAARYKELIALCERALRQLRLDCDRDKSVNKLELTALNIQDTTTLAAFLTQLSQSWPPHQRQAALYRYLCQTLAKGTESWEEKFGYILNLAALPPDDIPSSWRQPWRIMLDLFLAEILALSAGVVAVLGEVPNRATALLALLALYSGKTPTQQADNPLTQALARVLAQTPAPRTRLVLREWLLSCLLSAKSLAGGQFTQEWPFLIALCQSIQRQADLAMDADLAAACQRRAWNLCNDIALTPLLAGQKDCFARLACLQELEAQMPGADNRRWLMQRLRVFLEEALRHNAAEVPAQALSSIAALWCRLGPGEWDDPIRNWLERALDKVEKPHEILERLSAVAALPEHQPLMRRRWQDLLWQASKANGALELFLAAFNEEETRKSRLQALQKWLEKADEQ
jgi:hypothetical protein